MFFVQSILRSIGFESSIFAQHIDKSLKGRIGELSDLRVSKDDVLLIHHSMGHDIFSVLADLKCRKFLLYHNITPPKFFGKTDPYRHYSIKGYEQISLFRDIVEGAVAPSAFNAEQLKKRNFRDVTVIPFLKDFIEMRQLPHRRFPYYDEG